MIWPDSIVEEIKKAKTESIKNKPNLIVRDEKTASGRVHAGSLRGVAIHGIVSEILSEQGVNNQYLFEINDFDPMDGLPQYLDKEIFEPHLGKPLCNVPSPDGKSKNFAEYFAEEFKEAIKKTGFEPEFYLSSVLYKEGKFNEVIREALDHAAEIKKIYKEVSGSVKEDWLPISVICEKCGKISTTQGTEWDGKEVSYNCRDLDWTKGCGYIGKISPFDGNAKLPWKVEWAAKFKVLGVDVEGGGKDHSTKGGARDVSNHISKEIFHYEPPFDIPYEFFQSGGKKMSSSKGIGSSAKEVSDVLPTEILRLLLIQKEPHRVIEFAVDGDTVPILFDTYDSLAENYFLNKGDAYSRLFELAHLKESRKKLKKIFLPRFSVVSFIVQMPHLNLISEAEKLKGEELTPEEIEETKKRGKYAELWINRYAPEKYRFQLQEEFPDPAKDLNDLQKQALSKILEFVRSSNSLNGQQFHAKLHEIKEELSLEPKELFSALYLIFLGKPNGPKAGWFLSVLEKSFLESRLEEAIKS